MAWHPEELNILGFGTEDGTVGLIDIYATGKTTLFSSLHKGTVYSLSFAPRKKISPNLNDEILLYSVAGKLLKERKKKTEF